MGVEEFTIYSQGRDKNVGRFAATIKRPLIIIIFNIKNTLTSKCTFFVIKIFYMPENEHEGGAAGREHGTKVDRVDHAEKSHDAGRSEHRDHTASSEKTDRTPDSEKPGTIVQNMKDNLAEEKKRNEKSLEPQPHEIPDPIPTPTPKSDDIREHHGKDH
jgi:hypothetical protein